MKTVPSNHNYFKNKVVKTYDYKKFKKNFQSEIRVIKKFKSDHCIKIWDITNNGYTMERMDFAMGNGKGLYENNIRRILFSISVNELVRMLYNIDSDLKKFGIIHRDLNPGNLLWSEKQRLLKLTDFFWAKQNDENIYIPDYANPVYGQDDTPAIDKIKLEILEIFSRVKSEIQSAIDEFQKVGSGPYQDGSSSSPGRSYHIVDIPDFRDIPYSKDTCLREYKLIKNILPIEPESFVDIGTANGYFTFNLLRDFDIKHARSYERDVEPLNFLKTVKSIYLLDELTLSDAVDEYTVIDQNDVTIFLNSHMWIYKQLGRDRALQVVSNAIKSSKYMFFQTAGAYGKGRYRVEEYRNKEDVRNMLFQAGAKTVEFIDRTIGIHNAPRDIFMVT